MAPTRLRAMPFPGRAAGQLAGNHFITIVSNLERLPELGRLVLWEGAQRIRFGLRGGTTADADR